MVPTQFTYVYASYFLYQHKSIKLLCWNFDIGTLRNTRFLCASKQQYGEITKILIKWGSKWKLEELKRSPVCFQIQFWRYETNSVKWDAKCVKSYIFVEGTPHPSTATLSSREHPTECPNTTKPFRNPQFRFTEETDKLEKGSDTS